MAYFNNAATTFPKPEEVYVFMNQFYRNTGLSMGRDNSSGAIIKETRNLIQELLHCENKDVVFTATATMALNMIIQGVIKSNNIKNVYITPFEHNAVTRILHAMERKYSLAIEQLVVSKSLDYDLGAISKQFNNNPPDLVIMSHASNVCGVISPVEEISRIAKQFSSITVIDMAQTAGLVDLNVGNQNIDFAVFAGHKTLYGPMGISGFVCNDQIAVSPILYGGTGFDSINQNMPDDLPEKYEMGTMNIQAIAGLNASLKWILDKGISNIRSREHENRERLLKILEQYSNIKIVGNNPEVDSVGVLSILFDEYSSESIGEVLREQGITVRTGLHCAPLAHDFLGTSPAGTVRLSVSYFTSDEDFEKLEEVLEYIEENS